MALVTVRALARTTQLFVPDPGKQIDAREIAATRYVAAMGGVSVLAFTLTTLMKSV